VDRAFYHFRLAADLGHIEAREVVGEYAVSVTSPHKLRFTNGELEVIRKQFSGRENKTPHVRAPHGLRSTGSLDCAVMDFAYPQIELPSPQPAVARSPKYHEEIRT